MEEISIEESLQTTAAHGTSSALNIFEDEKATLFHENKILNSQLYDLKCVRAELNRTSIELEHQIVERRYWAKKFFDLERAVEFKDKEVKLHKGKIAELEATIESLTVQEEKKEEIRASKNPFEAEMKPSVDVSDGFWENEWKSILSEKDDQVGLAEETVKMRDETIKMKDETIKMKDETIEELLTAIRNLSRPRPSPS